MDPGSAFGAAGGAVLLSGGLNALSGSVSAKKQYKYTKKLMEAQQAWAEHAARHAHQWEVSDLRAAGLNPLLSVDTSGAVAHQAATPSISAPDYGKVDFASSAKWLTGEKKREKELQEQAIENAKKEGNRITAETAKAEAESARIMAHIAEGVGTPKQTKNVIYNLITQGIDNVVGTAKEAYNVSKDYGKLFLDHRTFEDVKEQVDFWKYYHKAKQQRAKEEEYQKYKQDPRKLRIIER